MAVDYNLVGVWIGDLDYRFLGDRYLSLNFGKTNPNPAIRQNEPNPAIWQNEPKPSNSAERTQTQQFGRTNPMPG
jgi:hypothetical protein